MLLYKNTLKKISKSIGRYLSILMIVFIGVGFYAGIETTAPNMKRIVGEYYQSQNLMDIKVVSTLGLTDDDVTALGEIEGVANGVPSYSLDVLANEKVIRLHALEESINVPTLVEGTLPISTNEVLADAEHYQIGDKIVIISDVEDKLSQTEFVVTGLVNSSLYLFPNYGTTNIGGGKLGSYIFIDKSNFKLDVYTEIYLTISDESQLKNISYTKEYEIAAKAVKDDIVGIKDARENIRYQNILDEANDEIRENERKINDEEKKAQNELNNAKVELDTNQKKLENARKELSQNEKQLNEKVEKQNNEFSSAKSKINDVWVEINAALSASDMTKADLEPTLSDLKQVQASLEEQVELAKGTSQYQYFKDMLTQASESVARLSALSDNIKALEEQEKALNAGITKFEEEIIKAKSEIEKGKAEIADNQKKLDEGYAEYEENLEKFNNEMADARQKIAEAKADLSEIETAEWYVFDRKAVIGYDLLDSSISVVEAISDIFPLFFILIAALMTSNSMARMISEERSEMGALTSLGYSNAKIMLTYAIYVVSASIIGVACGFFVGSYLIPPLIYANFMFIIPPMIVEYDYVLLLLSLIVTIIIMLIVTISACHEQLKHSPSQLLRPIPPKSGKRILLQRITPLWKRLSFSWKITARNIFRYKKRAFMTFIGVAGCTMLILIGFGLRDSMDGIADKQYEDILRYSNMIVLKDEVNQLSNELTTAFDEVKLEKPLLVRQTAFSIASESDIQDLYLIVPENLDNFPEYFHLLDYKTGETLSLNDEGAMITKTIANKLEIKIGDNITITDADNKNFDLKVSGIVDNYTPNYIYITKSLYEKTFGESIRFNTVVSDYEGNDDALAKQLIDQEIAVSVVFTEDMKQAILDNNKNLNAIIVLLVVVASMLALVVLYNLTSINISERVREIATLKVLGFNDHESNGYIYREAIVLAIISIGFGFVLGVYLLDLVIQIIETAAFTFDRKISLMSFVYSGVMTLAFSLIMQGITYMKLKTINMIEALKSVE